MVDLSYNYTDSRHFSEQGNTTVLRNIRCSPFDEHAESLLCDCIVDTNTYDQCNGGYIAYVVCRDDSRVKNVSAELITTVNASNVHMVSVTWVQNVSAAEPTSFEVKCRNDFNTITVIVNNKTNSTEQIGPVLPVSLYHCCVSGVYRDVYVARERCIQIETPELVMAINNDVLTSNSINVVGGVLGFIIVLLLVLLIISVVGLDKLCFYFYPLFYSPILT